MKVVFVGIYKIGVEALLSLMKCRVHVVCVVTKPSGDDEQQPVAVTANELKLPLLTPHSPRDPTFLKQIGDLTPDLIVVAGYHKLFPPALLKIPRLGVVNLHLSLLPRYRGPCPWKWAIANGESITGATVIMLNQEVDDGDILAQRITPIHDADTGESLFERLSILGGELIAETVESIFAGTATRRAQDASLATYQSAPNDDDVRIRWNQPATNIQNLVRGFHPRPGAWTSLAGVPYVIRAVSTLGSDTSSKPGTVIEVLSKSLLVAAGTGAIVIHDMRRKDQPHGDVASYDQLSIRCGDCFECNDAN